MCKRSSILKRSLGAVLSVAVCCTLFTASVAAQEIVAAEPEVVIVEEVQEVTATEPKETPVEVTVEEVLLAEPEVLPAEEVEAEFADEEEEVSFEAAYATGATTVTAEAANGNPEHDRKALQDALDKAKPGVTMGAVAGAIEVNVPAGTYRIDRALRIYSDTTLKLDKNTTIVRTDESEMMLIGGGWVSNSGEAPAGGYASRRNIRVEGGTWDGNKSILNGNESKNVFTFYHAENIVIANTTMKGCCGNHFIEFAGVKDSKVQNVTFTEFVRHKQQGVKTTVAEFPSAYSEAIQLDLASANTSSIAEPHDDTPCTGIEISGCTFDGMMSAAGNHHVGKNKGSNINIHDNLFKNMQEYCVNIEGFSNVTVKNNKAEKAHGFSNVNSSNGVVIEGNTATYDARWDNGSHEQRHLNICSDSTATYTGNSFTGAELILLYAKNSTVTLNKNIFTDNPARKNERNTIQINNSTLTSNGDTLKNARSAAIYLESGSKATLTGMTVESPKTIGIRVNAATVTIEKSTVTSAPEQGIQYTGKSKGKITGSTITGSGKNGIYIKDCDSVEISSNTIKDSTKSGIYLENATVTANGNTITNTKESMGINVTGKSKATLKKNTIMSPAAIGIRVDASSANLDANTITKAGSQGIQYTGKSSGKITNNTITGSAKNGIYAEDSKVTIEGNMISKSGKNSVLVMDGSNNVVLKVNKSAGWKKTGKRWWYENGDGTYPANAWKEISGKWYYFDKSGYMKTGWLKDGGKWYYLNKSGTMKTGWLKSGGKWYYFNKSGTMKTGWLKSGGKWYYFDKSGEMVADDSRTLKGVKYNFDKEGVCLNP